MSVLLHMSDAHFGTEREPVVDALVALTHEVAPDVVVLSGDITQRARADQFERARHFIQRLGVADFVVIPGNHDIPLFDVATRFFDPYREYRRVFGAKLEPRYVARDVLVVAVNTTRRYRHVDGEIGREQQRQVAAELSVATPSQLRIVVTHQPLAVPRESEQHNVARGADGAILQWSAAGADVLLAGHIHLPFVLPLHERTNLSRPLWAVNAGTAVSSRTRHDAGNSVNVLRVESADSGEPHCRVEHWAYEQPSTAFVRRAEFSLRTGARAKRG